MKQTMKKTLALLLVLVQMLVLFPVGMTTAKAADSEETQQVPELNPIISGTVQFGTFNYLSPVDEELISIIRSCRGKITSNI